MPIYEYQCEDCGVRFERLQSMSAPSVGVCPECGGKVHRVISSVGVIFKGSGFYVTDNRKSSSGSGRRTTKSDGETGTESKSDSETTSDSTAKESKVTTSSESD